MTYRTPDHLLWDFWFAPKLDGQPYTMFHLQAPASLADPEQRHWIATIGQATSDDLVHWSRSKTVFEQGTPGSWDDRAIWTGSVIEHDGLYYFFYTALSHSDSGATQRIGLATSVDLVHWERFAGNPVLTSDLRWYETPDLGTRGSDALRDPFVLWDEEKQEWLMVYCARARGGVSDARGVVGAARSTDLLHWESLPPLETPREFGQLEVPQIVRIADRWYLVFCTFDHSADRLARTGPSGNWCGTHYFVADNLRGPYRLLDDGPLDRDPNGVWYAGRIEAQLTDDPLFFAWLRNDESGAFGGVLSNPAPISVGPEGKLGIDSNSLLD